MRGTTMEVMGRSSAGALHHRRRRKHRSLLAPPRLGAIGRLPPAGGAKLFATCGTRTATMDSFYVKLGQMLLEPRPRFAIGAQSFLNLAGTSLWRERLLLHKIATAWICTV